MNNNKYDNIQILHENKIYRWSKARVRGSQEIVLLQQLKLSISSHAISQLCSYFQNLQSVHRSSLWTPEQAIASEDQLFIVYAFREVTALKSVLPANSQQALLIWREASDALHDLHNQNLVHGNICLNSFVMHQSRLLLTGFGYVPLFQIGNKDALSVYASHLAPEVKSQYQLSQSSDIFSFALMVGQWLPSLQQSHWFAQATSPNPDQRFSNIRECFGELRTILSKSQQQLTNLSKGTEISKTQEISSNTTDSNLVPIYTLIILISPDGAGRVETASLSYKKGEVATLTAISNLGYSFNGWTGDSSLRGKVLRIVMDSDKQITANFDVIRVPTSPAPTPQPQSKPQSAPTPQSQPKPQPAPKKQSQPKPEPLPFTPRTEPTKSKPKPVSQTSIPSKEASKPQPIPTPQPPTQSYKFGTSWIGLLYFFGWLMCFYATVYPLLSKNLKVIGVAKYIQYQNPILMIGISSIISLSLVYFKFCNLLINRRNLYLILFGSNLFIFLLTSIFVIFNNNINPVIFLLLCYGIVFSFTLCFKGSTNFHNNWRKFGSNRSGLIYFYGWLFLLYLSLFSYFDLILPVKSLGSYINTGYEVTVAMLAALTLGIIFVIGKFIQVNNYILNFLLFSLNFIVLLSTSIGLRLIYLYDYNYLSSQIPVLLFLLTLTFYGLIFAFVLTFKEI